MDDPATVLLVARLAGWEELPGEAWRYRRPDGAIVLCDMADDDLTVTLTTVQEATDFAAALDVAARHALPAAAAPVMMPQAPRAGGWVHRLLAGLRLARGHG